MSLLYPWILFFTIPLFLLYKSDTLATQKYKARQKRFLYLTLFFILLALSRPVVQNGMSEERFDAQDFIIAIDSSYSMQADDLQPSRYEVAKKTIATILKKCNRDRFTLFTFTTNAMLISPPTTDTQLSMLALNSLEPKYILTKGTSLLALFKAVAKSSFETKKLLLFSDGGEEHDLESLISIAKEANIIPYIVAVGSKDGTTLKKDGKTIKDEKNNLVVSRINPILKTLAYSCGGSYYELDNHTDITQKIITDLKTKQQEKESKVKVMNYTELYFLPLFISIILFFLSVTRFHQIYLFIPLLFTPHANIKAFSLFDFVTLQEAQQSFKDGNFSKSANAFRMMTPTLQSYYNSAVAYYKAKEYKKAMQLFSRIETKDPEIKQKIYYNMGNTAIALKKYDQAKIYYQKALALGKDEDALFNLLLLYKLQLKTQKDPSDMLPKSEKQNKNNISEQEKKETKETQQSKSQQKGAKKSAGSGSNTNKKQQSQTASLKKKSHAQYKIGYKAYELINKGYTNEKHPW